MNDDINDNGIINLKAEAERRTKIREAEEAAQKAKEAAVEPNVDRVYEVCMNNGDTFQASGVLMLTGSFFALGEPVRNDPNGAVDFNWAAPASSVNYVLALDDSDLED